jgi:hypothetical protein
MMDQEQKLWSPQQLGLIQNIEDESQNIYAPNYAPKNEKARKHYVCELVSGGRGITKKCDPVEGLSTLKLYASGDQGLTALIPGGGSWAKENPGNPSDCTWCFLFCAHAAKLALRMAAKQKTHNFRCGFSFAENEGLTSLIPGRGDQHLNYMLQGAARPGTFLFYYRSSSKLEPA